MQNINKGSTHCSRINGTFGDSEISTGLTRLEGKNRDCFIVYMYVPTLCLEDRAIFPLCALAVYRHLHGYYLADYFQGNRSIVQHLDMEFQGLKPIFVKQKTR